MHQFELARNPIYKKKIAKTINFSNVECQADVINLQDEKPTIMFGLDIENSKDYVAPFYITLVVHDQFTTQFHARLRSFT
jgi:hypothetical protein